MSETKEVTLIELAKVWLKDDATSYEQFQSLVFELCEKLAKVTAERDEYKLRNDKIDVMGMSRQLAERVYELEKERDETYNTLLLANAIAEDRLAKIAEQAAEIARLDAGWHEANKELLEVRLERTALKANAKVMAKALIVAHLRVWPKPTSMPACICPACQIARKYWEDV